jgi:regulator of protease activity HflC (stomatin/prohibitin superfamily)
MSAKTTTSVNPVTLGTIIAWSFLFIILLGFWGCPKYRVWQQEMEGKAEFAKAEQNRRIKIEEAKANLEAEKLNAEAEVERAKGAAKAIQIENGSITEKYIQYLWVRQQSNLNDKTVIYIPTEGNLPILEAGKRQIPKLPVQE